MILNRTRLTTRSFLQKTELPLEPEVARMAMVWRQVSSEELVQRVAAAVIEQLQPWLAQLAAQEDQVLERAVDPDTEDINALRRDLDLMLLREEKLRQQIQNYEREISQLTQENEELQQLIEELPEIYRQKFLARLAPIQARIRQIQEENYLLKSELIALHTSRPWTLPGLGSRPPRPGPLLP